MAFPLRKCRKSPVSKLAYLSNFLAGDGNAAGLQSLWYRQSAAFRGGRIEGKQVNGSYLPLHFLLDSFTHSSLRSTYCKIPIILPYPSSLTCIQKSLSLGREKSFNRFRHFCKEADSMRSDSEIVSEDDGEEYSSEDSSRFEVDEEEVKRVCKVIGETFALDRNMEAVLDDCGVKLSHELVLSVLHRFKHARKPAFRFFCWAAERPSFSHDSRTYNAMMDVLGKARQFETMVSVLEEMGEKGLLTIETFSICIKTFAAARERKKAVGMFDLMKKYKFTVDTEMINCLLDALGRARLVKEAQALFEKLDERFTPNLKTYTILLKGWCKVKNLMEAGRTWNEIIDSGFKPDIVAHNAMLEGLLRSQKRSDAIKLFELMRSKGPFPNVRSYTILIRYLCKHNDMKEAVDYLDDMLSSGCQPDAAIYTCLMMGFVNQKKMDMVHRVLKAMKEKGCAPDGRTYNVLIKMMTNRRMPDDAVEIYKKMIRNGIQPSIHTYNMLMKSYFVARNYEMGCEVWEEMKRKRCCPDENTYTVFVGGLIRLGRSNEACKYLEEMVDKGMKAPQLDYSKLRGDCRRARGWNIIELVGKMKFSGKNGIDNVFDRWER